MSAGPTLKLVVLDSREKLREGREAIWQQHQAGLPGPDVCSQVADLYDDVVLEIWNEAVAAQGPHHSLEGIALVAHGGFGRRDVAPYSDVDLMLLTTRGAAGRAARLAGPLSRDLVDAGIDVGFSIRTPMEACSLAWRDPIILSSLAESRFLAGSLQVYSKYFEKLRKGSIRRRKRLISGVVAARREERQKWGETNYLLRPNVKRSRGALRDIQLIRWLGFATYGQADLERLVASEALPPEDYDLLQQARGFMLRLRNELHFRAQRNQDVLDRPTQLAIAEAWGYTGSEGVLPVEQFMRDYFEHTQNVRYAASFFTDDTRARPIASRLLEVALSKRIDKKIRMGPTHIWVVDSALEEFARSLPDIFRLMHLASHHRRRIAHKTWLAIRQAMQERAAGPLDAEAISSFLSLLSRPGRLAPLLRRLHELRVLEQVIPAFKRCRGLLQFNAYHKYTVDEHCIRAVEAATKLESDPSAMGRRYRRLKDKTLLHLALLIHDLGKGYQEDHCQVGRRIAKETAELLDFDTASSETLQWLIEKHLTATVVAFRHDLNDSEIVLSFAADVGSIRRLELLVVHSVADLEAVGPGVITDWKMNLMESLYKRTRRYFDTGALPGESDLELERTRARVRALLIEADCPVTCGELLDKLPPVLLRRGDPETVTDELLRVGRWLEQGSGSWCSGWFDPSLSAMRYTVVRRQRGPQIATFTRITGGLSTCGLTILRANVEMVGDDLVWDDFWVSDPDFPGPPSQRRIDEVCQQVCRLLDTPDAPLPPHRRTWTTRTDGEPDMVNVLPTKVTFDNETFDRYTILSLFTYDQVGLLYRVAATLTELEVVLHFAKIDTYLDQIADVFYVTELDGGRILGPHRQAVIRAALIKAVG